MSLFTRAELASMKARLHGDYSDPQGIFSNRARPKLKEILAWTTPRMRAQIKKLLKQKRKRDIEDNPTKPNEEQSFEEFKQKVGY